MLEKVVIDDMKKKLETGTDVCEEALKLVQPCQIHNADQLSDWCLSYLAQNYNTVCRRCHSTWLHNFNLILIS